MPTFLVFIVSLFLIAILFVIKNIEISSGQKFFWRGLFLKSDAWIIKIILRIKHWWGHINFRNLRLIFSWIMAKMRKLVISIKKRFDHRQSHFFTRKDDASKSKNGSVSFFLKNVSEYKKNLREKEED